MDVINSRQKFANDIRVGNQLNPIQVFCFSYEENKIFEYEKKEINLANITKFYNLRTNEIGIEILDKQKISINTSYFSCFKTLTTLKCSIVSSLKKKNETEKKETKCNDLINRVVKRRNYIKENLMKIQESEHKVILDFAHI